MPQLCEARECAAAQTVEPCDDANEPYHLCVACHQRLHARALRPFEWYNLAKRHGWYQFLLHDDFYDEDGTASQPEDGVECPGDFSAPSLAAAARVTGRTVERSALALMNQRERFRPSSQSEECCTFVLLAPLVRCLVRRLLSVVRGLVSNLPSAIFDWESSIRSSDGFVLCRP